MTIILRSSLSQELTHEQLDGNFTDLDGKTSIFPYYHFHGFAGNQIIGDEFYDLSGTNHCVRGAALSNADMFTTPGYVSTLDPAGVIVDTSLHIPSINYDYVGGEKLIVWWLGSGSPEGANVPIIGDGYTNTIGTRGWRIRMMSTGKFDFNLFGATSGYGSSSDGTAFDGTLHSFAVCADGSAKTYGLWSDGVFHPSFGSTLNSFGGGTAYDTLSSNTVNIGSTRPSSAANTEGAAIKTRALVIIRLPYNYPTPSVAKLTTLFKQLRVNPGKLILRNAI